MILRTPDSRFSNLDGFPFEPRYATVIDARLGPLRVHYVDEGPADAAPVLLLHGEPTWSYLYRKMIPAIAAAGNRVVAPDLIGFGRSDKPAERGDYTYESHVAWMERFLLDLDLQKITLFCQDWGGLIGLRLVAAHPDRFARVVASNTFLPTGDAKPSEAFYQWRAYSQRYPDLNAGKVIRGACVRPVAQSAIDAYNAPYPDASHKAGMLEFPMLVPDTPDNPSSEPNRRAWKALMKFDKPFLTAFADKDPVTAGGDRAMQKLIPGCAGQPHVTIKDAGHFIQEDAGAELAELVNRFVGGR